MLEIYLVNFKQWFCICGIKYILLDIKDINNTLLDANFDNTIELEGKCVRLIICKNYVRYIMNQATVNLSYLLIKELPAQNIPWINGILSSNFTNRKSIN